MNHTYEETIEESSQSRKRPRPPDGGGAPPRPTSPSSEVPSEVIIDALKRKLLEMVKDADIDKARCDSLDAALSMEKREHRVKTLKLTTLIHQKQELNHKNQAQEADLCSLRDTVSQLQMQVTELQAQNKTLKEVKIEQFNQKMDQLEKQNQHLRALVADWCTMGAAPDAAAASTPTAPVSVRPVACQETEAAAVELIRLTSSEARPPAPATATPATAPTIAPTTAAPVALAPARVQAAVAPVVPVSAAPAISVAPATASADTSAGAGLSVQIPPAVSRPKSIGSPQQTELTPTAQPVPHVAAIPVPAIPVPAPARATVAASAAALKNAEPRVITTSAPARTASVMVNNKSTTTTSRRYFGSDAAGVQVVDSSGNARRSLLMGEATPYGYAKGAIYVV